MCVGGGHFEFEKSEIRKLNFMKNMFFLAGDTNLNSFDVVLNMKYEYHKQNLIFLVYYTSRYINFVIATFVPKLYTRFSKNKMFYFNIMATLINKQIFKT